MAETFGGDTWIVPPSQNTKNAVLQNFPVLRPKTTHPTSVVPQNEFIVGETISPPALLFGGRMDVAGHIEKTAVPAANIPFYSMP